MKPEIRHNSTLVTCEDQIELAARARKVSVHPPRLQIPRVKRHEETSVQDIAEAAGPSQSNISQRLAILREKDTLRSRRDANRDFYAVTDQRTLKPIVMTSEVFRGIRARS